MKKEIQEIAKISADCEDFEEIKDTEDQEDHDIFINKYNLFYSYMLYQLCINNIPLTKIKMILLTINIFFGLSIKYFNYSFIVRCVLSIFYVIKFNVCEKIQETTWTHLIIDGIRCNKKGQLSVMGRTSNLCHTKDYWLGGRSLRKKDIHKSRKGDITTIEAKKDWSLLLKRLSIEYKIKFKSVTSDFAGVLCVYVQITVDKIIKYHRYMLVF